MDAREVEAITDGEKVADISPESRVDSMSATERCGPSTVALSPKEGLPLLTREQIVDQAIDSAHGETRVGLPGTKFNRKILRVRKVKRAQQKKSRRNNRIRARDKG